MIVPPKAEITKAEAADYSIRLAFTDDRPIGATGYVTVPTILQVELDYYGEYSDTLTVAVP